MNHQSEQSLENNLIQELQKLEYDYVTIKDENDLITNLKTQLETHNFWVLNGTPFSQKEFQQVLHHLDKWNIFERAQILRDKILITRDNDEKIYIRLINMEQWCQNEYQVTHQTTMEGNYKNRYDVTILVNGLPLAQIELKRRWLELKEAFNQTWRYHKHSYASWYGLFQYIQVFVISNGVNTKYYANNKNTSFKQTFFWADENNKNITNLIDFTKVFLEPCHLSKMITKYTVLNQTEKALMILRPYQFYAVEKIIDRVQHTEKNGYIWHTTGSGKTLTSFKTSQILTKLPGIDKVVFVVDRKDLDYQTAKEFNDFSAGSIDGTDDTKKLVSQFDDINTPLIITTIQKLNTAISKEKYLKTMESMREKKIVFIFDECHRSQFGETHKKIKAFFTNAQMIGFTWTPIFVDNVAKNELWMRTTKDLFDECLHKYVITDAINDENVLKFSVEYVGKYKQKENSQIEDIKVENIDTKELLEDPSRLEKIVDYILANHNAKTHNREFTSIFCVSSVDVLIKYYEIFKRKNHNFKIATIFSYGANETDADANGFIWEDNLEIQETQINKHSREKLDEFIADYNEMFQTTYSTKDTKEFYNYYQNIAKRVKQREVDILLVVNMFLTWFDSKTLNTLYVDKNLKYHWLIQAFSRTNRILNEQKSSGNIVCFRNLKEATDEAITLFSNKEARDIVLMEPLENYINTFNQTLAKMQTLVPTPESVDELLWEGMKFEFVRYFRELLRLKNILTTFSDFSFEKLSISYQTFEDYKSKYLDIYEATKTVKQVVSILNDVDFELELIIRDEINVDYILELLSKIKTLDTWSQEKQKQMIVDMLGNEPTLRNKKDLILKFIEENLPKLEKNSDVQEAFKSFYTKEKAFEFEKLCSDENIDGEKLQKVIARHLFSQVKIREDEIAESLNYKPWFFEREEIIERIYDKIEKFIHTFEEI